MNFIAAICLTIIGPSLPRLGADFDLDLGQMGLLFTFEFVGFTAFTFFSGIIADYIGKRKTAILSLIMLTVSIFVLTLSPNFVFLGVVLVFLGGGMGVMEILSNSLLSDICDEEDKTYQIVFMQCFFGAGAVVGPILISLAYSYGVSWRSVYQVLGIALIALTVWFLLNKFPPLPAAAKIDLRGFANLISDKKFLLICLCMFLYTGAESCGWGWMAEFTESVMRFSVLESGAAVAVFWLAMTISRLIAAKLLHKVDVRTFIMGFSLSAGIICAIMGFVDNTVLTWIIIILLGFACSGIWGMILSYGAAIFKKNTGTTFATISASGGVGMSVIPALMGVTGKYVGLRWSLVFPAVSFVLIMVLFIIIPGISPKKENL